MEALLCVKKSEKGIVYVALYVYNNLMIGDIEAINKAIMDLKENELVLKIMEGLSDYLSCKVKFSRDKKRHGYDSFISSKTWLKNWQQC